MTESIRVYEMGPRDGLQSLAVPVSTPDKIALIDRLSGCGLRHIEAASFVHPRWVPQMADASAVMQGITRQAGVTYAALVPNLRGLEGALAAQVSEIAVFASASQGFSQANINCSIEHSLERFAPVVHAALAAGLRVRGYVSCITHCPYDGEVTPAQTATVSRCLLDLGCYEISLGDTLGRATPATLRPLLDAVLADIPASQLAGHFHDTFAHALDNVDQCLDYGLRGFDASVGGLGGCPYAPGARGNVATEALIERLHQRGWSTGVDVQRLAQVVTWTRHLLGADPHV